VSLRRQLCQLDAAPRKDEELLGGVPFVEEELGGVDAFQMRESDDRRQNLWRHIPEQGKRGESPGEIRGLMRKGHRPRSHFIHMAASASAYCLAATKCRGFGASRMSGFPVVAGPASEHTAIQSVKRAKALRALSDEAAALP
jgi:hypothetical protein